MQNKQVPYLSIVVPVYNEQAMLPIFFERTKAALENYGRSYELILVNDGSRDASEQMLQELQANHPDTVRVINFNTNYGQHMAIMAGFERVRGEIVITLDADLQNLPEDISKLVVEIEAGHDVVGGYRQQRQDQFWRLLVSRLHNKLWRWIAPKIAMKDEGCMLRAYRRDVVKQMVASGETSTFIPALALIYASNPTEVPVRHAAREAGQSNYNFYRLIRYNFDLVTGFSLVPLQWFTLIGMIVSLLSALLVGYLFIRRLFIGPEADGVFTLFAIMYLLVGIGLMGLGILGEYIGRIYREVLKRPRFIVKSVFEKSFE